VVKKNLKIAVVGGGGHVGLPLSLILAKKGFFVHIIDTDKAKIGLLQKGVFPFMEEGGPELLRAVKNKIAFSSDPSPIAKSDVVILTIGTPVDDHLNPDLIPVYKSIDALKPYLRNGQVIILRSTLYPGTSEAIGLRLKQDGFRIGISFCPERIAQNVALRELEELPQIISGSDARALSVAKRVFSAIAPETLELSLTEAELAKLFTNSWRYIKFAVANQFYMMAEGQGLDFYKIRNAMMHRYKRAADFPSAGFAAGPCLFKDTMQLAAYTRQTFQLGNAAMLLNETLPEFLVDYAKRKYKLAGKKVGILGMAFKADSDDFRGSLAFKLRRLLVHEQAKVFCTDPFVSNPSFTSLETVLKCDVIFIGCPHTPYRKVNLKGKKVIDCWGFLKK
jgi:UDP-N-acetyl-D-mannosaminuronic acid dehydrogenase